jgi:Membrane domain of glycerophosphoryl diester phosphodiesterase
MPRLSITQAWNETAQFMRRDFGPLFTIALALIALPNFALQALAPRLAVAGAGTRPLVWGALLVVALLCSMAGSLAISALALGRENVVGRAIGHGFRRVPAMLAASLLVGVPMALAAGVLAVLLKVPAEALVAPTPATAGRLLVYLTLLMILLVPIGIRLMLMTPVAAAEAVGPVAIVRRGWTLTSGHFWKLLGFVLLLVVALLIVTVAISAVTGILVTLVLGRPQPGSLSALVMLLVGGVVNAAFTVVLTTMVARIYVQLAGGGAATTGS